MSRRRAASVFEGITTIISWMGLVVERANEPQRPQSAAERRAGLVAGAYRSEAGLDAGGNLRRTVQARFASRMRNGLAFLPEDISFKENSCTPAARALALPPPEAWKEALAHRDLARLVFIDETGTSTAMVRLRGSPRRGQRVIGPVPWDHWKIMIFLAALRHGAITAPFVIDRAMTCISLNLI
jgi:hypothetical protein